MDCLCGVLFSIGTHGCLVCCYLLENSPLIGIVALYAICLIISLDRLFYSDEHYEIKIEGTDTVREGETAHLKGIVKFHHSMKLLKWQKFQNGKYIDINMQKPKYKGSSNDLVNPTLFSHDVDAEDEVDYRLEVDTRRLTVYSSAWKLKVLASHEIPRIDISTNVKKNTYYVGEDVTITAHIENPSSVLCAMWQMETLNGDHAIDTTLPKYKGTNAIPNEAILVIRDCCEADIGTYFLLAASSGDTEITSNKLHLNIIEDCPKVRLTVKHQKQEEIQQLEEDDREIVTEVMSDECVEFKATIRSFPKHGKIEWFRDSTILDLSNPKYDKSSSSCQGDKTVLRINKVAKEDEDTYKIEVHNALGNEIKLIHMKVTGESPNVKLRKLALPVTYGDSIILEAEIVSRPPPTYIEWKKGEDSIILDGTKFSEDKSDEQLVKLTISDMDFDDSGEYSVLVTNAVGSKDDHVNIDVTIQAGKHFLFISGPVVVLTSTDILFKTIFPPKESPTQAKWFRIQSNTTSEIQFGVQGNTKRTYAGVPSTESVNISNSMDKLGSYQLRLNNMISNKITVFAEESGKFSTEKEENFLRFFSLLIVSKDAMKKKLAKDMVPDSFQILWKKYVSYCSANKKNVPNKTSLDELDISLMYQIYRNIIPLPPPTNGWKNKPNDADDTEADAIQRIHLHRNKICHSDHYEMTTERFNDSALDLIRAIQRLSNCDEKFITQICDVLSKVFCKGKEIEDMMEKVKAFRETALETEHLSEHSGTTDEESRDIKFHHVYGSAVALFRNSAIAYKYTCTNAEGGIVFMNLHMKIGEKIFIRGRTEHQHIIKIGLTNTNPNEFRLPNGSIHVKKRVKSTKRVPLSESYHAWISLKRNAELTVSVNECEPHDLYFANLSTDVPLWLLFELPEKKEFVQISNQTFTESIHFDPSDILRN